MAGPVDLILLRGLLADLPVRPGLVLHARVVDAQTVLLEGARLAAQLPEGVEPGAVLRVRVEEASSERLHLRIMERPAGPEPPATAQVPPAAIALTLPGGVQARIFVDEREEGGRARRGEARSVVVRYDSPTLGRMDVRVHAGAAAVHVPAGEPAARVRAAAETLAAALRRATGGPARVTVHPRGETFDASA